MILSRIKKWIRQYGIRKVRGGVIEYIADRLESRNTEEIWEALELRLRYGQVALLKATTRQLAEEVNAWMSDDGVPEAIEACIRGGDAVPVKEDV